MIPFFSPHTHTTANPTANQTHDPTRPIPAPSMMLCRPARGTVSLHRHRLCLQYTTAATATTAPSWSSSLRPRIVRGGGATSPAGTPGLMQPCPRPHPLTARCYGTDSSGTHRARAGVNHSPATPTPTPTPIPDPDENETFGVAGRLAARVTELAPGLALSAAVMTAGFAAAEGPLGGAVLALQGLEGVSPVSGIPVAILAVRQL